MPNIEDIEALRKKLVESAADLKKPNISKEARQNIVKEIDEGLEKLDSASQTLLKAEINRFKAQSALLDKQLAEADKVRNIFLGASLGNEPDSEEAGNYVKGVEEEKKLQDRLNALGPTSGATSKPTAQLDSSDLDDDEAKANEIVAAAFDEVRLEKEELEVFLKGVKDPEVASLVREMFDSKDDLSFKEKMGIAKELETFFKEEKDPEVVSLVREMFNDSEDGLSWKEKMETANEFSALPAADAAVDVANAAANPDAAANTTTAANTAAAANRLNTFQNTALDIISDLSGPEANPTTMKNAKELGEELDGFYKEAQNTKEKAENDLTNARHDSRASVSSNPEARKKLEEATSNYKEASSFLNKVSQLWNHFKSAIASITARFSSEKTPEEQLKACQDTIESTEKRKESIIDQKKDAISTFKEKVKAGGMTEGQKKNELRNIALLGSQITKLDGTISNLRITEQILASRVSKKPSL